MNTKHLFAYALTGIGIIGIGIIGLASTSTGSPTGLALDEMPAPPAATQPVVTSSTTTTAPADILVGVVESKPTRGTAVQVAETVYVAPTTTLRAWTGPRPAHYGAGTECSPEEADMVARAMWAAGANDDSVLWMLATISRESTCDPAAHNGNRGTGDDSYGLCQLNTLAGFFKPGQILAEFDRFRFANDFFYNAQACAELWTVCGRGPWNYGNYYCRTPDELR